MMQRLTAAPRRLLVLGLVLWGLGFGSPPSAFAQSSNVDAARAAEAEARAAFRDKRYAVAAEGFAAAFRLDPKANTKYNEALAWNKAGEPAAAADAYEAALAFGGLGGELAKAGTDTLATLKTQLGRLVVDVPLGAKVSVAHAKARGVPTKIHLAPGLYEVSATLPDGSVQDKTVTIVAGSDLELAFDVAESEPVPSPEGTNATPPAAGDDGGRDGDMGLVIAGWTLVGLGAAALIGMGVTGALTLSKVAQYDDTGNTDVELHDEAVTLKTTTNVLLAAGSGVAAIGAVLLIVATVGDDDDAAFAPTANGFRVRF